MRPRPFGAVFDADVQPQLRPRGSVLAVHAQVGGHVPNLWQEEHIQREAVSLTPANPRG